MNRNLRPFVLALPLMILGCVNVFNHGDAESPVREPAAVASKLDSSGYAYNPEDRSCDGYPKLNVRTAPGTCLGLVVGKDQAKGLTMPRTLLALRGTADLLLVDMGGWKPNNGSLHLLQKSNTGYKLKLIKSGLNLAHGLQYGADDYIYIGESHQISRFRFVEGQIKDWELVVAGLPRHKGHMHPLTQITFDPRNGDMFVNSGAPTDHCYAKDTGGYVTCPEVTEMGLGAIYRYPGDRLKTIPKGGVVVREQAASGLRNSMAMVVSDSGYLIQGENSRDFPEQEEPYEELNVIAPDQRGLNYGWPQCYNFHAKSPEFQFPLPKTKKPGANSLRERFNDINCDTTQVNTDSFYQTPHALLPPHAAPLSAQYYKGSSFGNALNGKLLMTWHGYQPSGHRVVAFEVDKDGRPLTRAVDKDATFSNDRAGGRCPIQKPFSPRGGLKTYAPYTELISGWDEKKGVRPKGSPVGLTVAADGSIWIAEDKNRTIVRLAKSSLPASTECAEDRVPDEKDDEDPRIELLAWRSAVISQPSVLAGYEKVRDQFVSKYCVTCHGGFKDKEIADDRFSTLDFLIKNAFVTAGSVEKSKLYSAISGTGEYPAMPPAGSTPLPGGAESAKLLALVKQWIEGLPTEVDKSFVKIQLGSARDIRSGPSASKSKVCGELKPGDFIYVDPRSTTRPKADGWLWTKLYLLPGSARLDPTRCQYPADGTYYIKLKKL